MAGPAGRSDKAGDVLEVVEKQIDDIHRDLDAQMKRTAQIQEQLDDLCATVRAVLSNPPEIK